MAGAETVCPAEEKGARRAPAGSADAPPSAPRKRQKAPLAFRSGAEREGQPKEIGLLRYIIEWCIGFRVQDLGFLDPAAAPRVAGGAGFRAAAEESERE